MDGVSSFEQEIIITLVMPMPTARVAIIRKCFVFITFIILMIR